MVGSNQYPMIQITWLTVWLCQREASAALDAALIYKATVMEALVAEEVAAFLVVVEVDTQVRFKLFSID